MRAALTLFLFVLSGSAALAGEIPGLTITKLPIPEPRTVSPYSLAQGSEGRIWFTDLVFAQAGYIASDGSIYKFPLIDPANPSNHVIPHRITEGSDGNGWISVSIIDSSGAPLNRDSIVKLTPTGTFTFFGLPTGNGFQGFFGPEIGAATKGPDNNVWMVESQQKKVVRITPSGGITEFPPVSAPESFGGLMGIAAAGGNLVATDYNRGSIWRFSTLGAATELKIPEQPFAQPWTITGGADGNIYFTARNGNAIGQLTAAGTFNLVKVPTLQALPNQIAAFPDGSVLFTETTQKKIGQLVPSSGTINETAAPNGENPYSIIPFGPNQFVFNASPGITSLDFNVYTATIAAPATPKLTVTKSALDNLPRRVGDPVCYVIKVENTSEVDAAPGITIVDKVPEDTELFPNFVPDTPTGVDCAINQFFLRCTVRNSLRAHALITLTPAMCVKPTKEGTIRNTATIDGGGDPNNPQDSNIVRTTVIARSPKHRAVGRK